MLKASDRVVVGVSGGADSVCLFLLLLEYAKRVPLSLAVVHVNHGIRREAGEDALYVENLCRSKGVLFRLINADVVGLARAEGCSEEDAGRRVRYHAFCQTAKQLGGARIAVAHNSNDNAETMLFHLFRGSGIQGLGGIAPVRGQIIRPILCLERREVEAYLRNVPIRWCEDATNEGDAYRRNRIRHHILPYAEREVAAEAVAHMNNTARLLQETEAYLERQTQDAFVQCAKPAADGGDGMQAGDTGGFRIDIPRFLRYHVVIQKRMILETLKRLSPTGKDIAAVHVADTLALALSGGNRSISLPFGIRASRQYDGLILERAAKRDSSHLPLRDWPLRVSLGEEIFRNPFVYGREDWGKIEVRAFYIKKGQEVPLKRYTKWFDYDKIKECITVRFRQQGDFLTIIDGAGEIIHKSVKKYMITEKIPRQMRDEIPVVAEGSHVLWLAGWRMSASFQVDGSTKRIVQIRFTGKKFCEGSETEEKDVREH